MGKTMPPFPSSTFLLFILCITDHIHQWHAFTATTPPPTSRATTKSGGTGASSEAGSTDSTLTLFSPCKINLFLRIIRKRPDGYHDLASLFQAIGFGDSLDLTKIPVLGGLDDDDADAEQRDVFTCNMDGVPTDSSNLVIRALELMRTKTGVRQFFRANLTKQCPAQAGLGGGSANAATALWGANELMGRPASLDDVSCKEVE
jgi:4-diphosphocytidyl-2-C-methyl-D-erythritol kinase